MHFLMVIICDFPIMFQAFFQWHYDVKTQTWNLEFLDLIRIHSGLFQAIHFESSVVSQLDPFTNVSSGCPSLSVGISSLHSEFPPSEMSINHRLLYLLVRYGRHTDILLESSRS